ncbi:MAG: DUF2891 domain-containing protein [Crocinitomicaceae bacterium]|nr:DUF2891 domain-containing protein [Crocinitomicaceae bacterium]
MRKTFLLTSLLFVFGCGPVEETASDEQKEIAEERLNLSIDQATKLMELPLTCIDAEYPNKLSQVIGSDDDLQSPKNLHPAFYGCFDWHSAVHGHWSIVRMINVHPTLEGKEEILRKLLDHLSAPNITAEIEYFKGELNGSYERMYGWAWLLKLSVELAELDDPREKELSENLKPLHELIADKVKEFLPKLNYPIRVGTHTNTAFAMTMVYDYAVKFNDIELKELIEQRAKDFFMDDADCPMTWEPSGYDFLSPCLEEADIMRRVLPKEEFENWLTAFLPQLSNANFVLAPGEVSDRTDGHLVHLDGLNFSRAWCLYGIAETLPEDYGHLVKIANEHVNYSLPNLVGDSYEGGHWLASFALLSLGE